ncbi:hypothetical protein SynSYN20_01205 [Synechococcus sp. SYN20]|nr:hypothetical protein SynSYN20_01205 [Synechococcus sp. SYN20]
MRRHRLSSGRFAALQLCQPTERCQTVFASNPERLMTLTLRKKLRFSEN